MQTPWIEEQQLQRTLERNEAFWDGALEGPPIPWITVPGAKPGTPPAEPATDEALRTGLDYFVDATEDRLARTWHGGDDGLPRELRMLCEAALRTAKRVQNVITSLIGYYANSYVIPANAGIQKKELARRRRENQTAAMKEDRKAVASYRTPYAL